MGPQLACMLALVCGFLVGRDRRSAHLLLRVIAVSGLVYALYGILAFVVWPDHLLWLQKSSYGSSLVITFSNPNVAAVYLGTSSTIWLLFSVRELQRSAGVGSGTLTKLADKLLNRPTSETIICLAATFVAMSAIFMTGSRAGTILSLLVMFGGMATLHRRKLQLGGTWIGFVASSAVLVVIAAQLLGGRVSERLSANGLFDMARWSVYGSTVEIIRDNPWLGTGLGTFRWAFPSYRSDDISVLGIWQQAHSSPLEFASEMGIPLTVELTIALVVVFAVLIRGIHVRKRDTILPTAALWVGVLALAHSSIDFSLQIPGFSLPVFALFGMGLAQAAPSRPLNPKT